MSSFIVEKLLFVLTIAHNLGLCWWKLTVIHDEGNSWLNSGNPSYIYRTGLLFDLLVDLQITTNSNNGIQ